MTTTLAELADRAQLTLNDSGAGTWPQATIEEWVVEAIRDYTQSFPRTITSTITVSGASPGHEFDLHVVRGTRFRPRLHEADPRVVQAMIGEQRVARADPVTGHATRPAGEQLETAPGLGRDGFHLAREVPAVEG